MEEKTPRLSNAILIALWIVQVALSVSLFWAAIKKLFQPIEELELQWPWVAQVPETLVKGTGMVDLLAGMGILLPQLLKIKPWLTVATAWGLLAVMFCASVFHIGRGEAALLGPNVIFAALAVFVIWGRRVS
ncbi:MAG: DoxX family protein [Spirosomataceae bacterium]